MRRALLALAAVAVVAVVVIGLSQAGGDKTQKLPKFDLSAAQRKLATAPPPLNGLYAQANKLLEANTSSFTQRLDGLKGKPLVINMWASWCIPCQSEFPIFQSVATTKGDNVGFLGLDVNDVNSAARRFLAKRPLPYPSYADPHQHLTHSISAPVGYAPVTVFVKPDGKTAYIHSGAYTSTKQLSDDIDRYL